ncbi:unnamed protein product, partial [Allacma fusca]
QQEKISQKAIVTGSIRYVIIADSHPAAENTSNGIHIIFM